MSGVHVLVVQGDVLLRTALLHGLERLEGVTVSGAGTVVKALSEVEERRPQVVFVDLDLPDGSGLEVLEAIDRMKAPCSVTIVLPSTAAPMEALPGDPQIQTRRRPLELEDLRQIVVARREDEGARAPSSFRADEYLQIAARGRHSVVIRIGAGAGLGFIAVVDGEPWTAEDATGAGPPAFVRLLRQRELPARCSTLRSPPGPRTLPPGSAAGLLIEAANAEPSPAEAFADAWERAIEAAVRRDLAAAREWFERAGAIRTDPLVEVNLARLDALGVSVPVASLWSIPPAGPPTARALGDEEGPR